MPDWLMQVLIQYPIVVVIGFVAWYAYKELKETQLGRLRREEENHAKAVSDQKEFSQRLDTAKNVEFARLRDVLLEEIKKLAKKVDELNRRLDA